MKVKLPFDFSLEFTISLKKGYTSDLEKVKEYLDNHLPINGKFSKIENIKKTRSMSMLYPDIFKRLGYELEARDNFGNRHMSLSESKNFVEKYLDL